MNLREQICINLMIFLSLQYLTKKYIFEVIESGLIVYKTKGHCWNVPSPCVQNLEKLSLKTTKKNGYYFFIRN